MPLNASELRGLGPVLQIEIVKTGHGVETWVPSTRRTSAPRSTKTCLCSSGSPFFEGAEIRSPPQRTSRRRRPYEAISCGCGTGGVQCCRWAPGRNECRAPPAFPEGHGKRPGTGLHTLPCPSKLWWGKASASGLADSNKAIVSSRDFDSNWPEVGGRRCYMGKTRSPWGSWISC